MLKRNNCFDGRQGPSDHLACLEIPVENENENIFQRSSFDTEHQIMIYGRRKCREDLSNFKNIIEDISKSNKGNITKVFNTATTVAVHQISPILFLIILFIHAHNSLLINLFPGFDGYCNLVIIIIMDILL